MIANYAEARSLGDDPALSLAAVPFVPVSGGIVRLRENALRLLRSADGESGGADTEQLESVAMRWEAALTDDVGLLPPH